MLWFLKNEEFAEIYKITNNINNATVLCRGYRQGRSVHGVNVGVEGQDKQREWSHLISCA